MNKLTMHLKKRKSSLQMGWSTARTQNAVRTLFANEVNFATQFLRQLVSI